jgi:hypothetical protein
MADEPKTDTHPTGGDQSQAEGPTGGATFTQEELDRAIERRLARERAKYADYDRLKAELAEKTGAVETVRREADATLEALRTERVAEIEDLGTQLEAARQALARERVHRALASASARAGAYDPDQVAVLLADRARLGPDGAVLVDVDGGEAVSSERGVPAYLEANPHLVRPTGRGGAGSATNRPGEGALFTRESIRAMSPDEFRRREREILQAARKGLIR